MKKQSLLSGITIVQLFFASYCISPATGMDTLRIAPVEVVSSRFLYFANDKKQTVIDSLNLAANYTLHLGELLEINSSVHVMSYGGAGSVSSVSLRGSGSNHTLVTWNGFPLNSLSTGGADLSVIPVEFSDRITIMPGAPASIYGSGTFGGSVNLTNHADWENRYKFSVSTEIGSFGYLRYGAGITVGNKMIQYSLNGFHNRAENDFSFINTEKFGQPSEVLNHNGLVNSGILQNLIFKPGHKQSLEVGAWYQVKEKKIPEIMSSYGTSNQAQKDSSLKIFLKYKKLLHRSNLELRSAYMMDYLRYTDKENATDDFFIIDSRIKTNRILNDLNYRIILRNNVSIDLGGMYSILLAETDNYETTAIEHVGDVFTGLKIYSDRINSNLTLRKTFSKYKDPSLLYSIGVSSNLLNKKLQLRANLSNKFRRPGFNDKYWTPGGNPELKPEQGWGVNIGAAWCVLASPDDHNRLQLETDLFSSVINDWIQWIPSETSGLWKPVNYKKIWSRGMETSLVFNRTSGDLKTEFKIGYTLTYSTNIEAFNDAPILGNQIRYVPVHTGNASIAFDYRKLFALVYHGYTGDRYTTDDNDGKLNGYNITNLLLGYKAGRKENFTFHLRIANIFNSAYQAIQSYPMPGRAFYLGVKSAIYRRDTNEEKN